MYIKIGSSGLSGQELLESSRIFDQTCLLGFPEDITGAATRCRANEPVENRTPSEMFEKA
jgi:hypothetical protein